MEVLLLGTGSPGGWPQPGCRCASCACAAPLRLPRAPTSVLVDDVLLIDPSAEVARQAARSGRSLSKVRRILLSDASPPPAVVALVSSLAANAPVEVLGPPRALEPYAACPGVRAVVVASGDSFHGDRHVLRGWMQRDDIVWEMVSSEGARLLYAPGAAAVEEATVADIGATAYDVVLLGVGASDAGPGRCLARLRDIGAVTDSTDVLAVGIGHDAGLPDVLEERLRGWGARAVPDGAVLHVGDGSDAQGQHPPLRGRTLVLGGARSGKSALAEQLLAAQPRVTYVATGGTWDDDVEWRERVAAHVARRPAAWRTVETCDVAQCLRTADSPLLIDCLGTWLTSRLDAHGVWDGASTRAVEADVTELVLAWRSAAVPVVAVSNEVGSGVVPATVSGRLFQDLLGRLNATIAAESETVLLTVAGIAVPLRVRTST